MVRRNKPFPQQHEIQNKEELEFMSIPATHSPMSNILNMPILQTHNYPSSSPETEVEHSPISIINQEFSKLDTALKELSEIRQEAENAYAADSEIDPIPDSAYNQTSDLLEKLFSIKIPMPHIGWAEDGSIGLEWRPEDGIVTMGIYGDDDVIYGAFFQENRQVDGVCSLSDSVLLEGFLKILKNLL